MTGMIDPDDRSTHEALIRSDRAVRRVLEGKGGDGDLDAAIADLLSVPDELRPSPLAGALLVALLRSGPDAEPHRTQHVETLLAIADRDPPPWPQWATVQATARVVATMARVKAKMATDESRDFPDIGAVLSHLDELENLPYPPEVTAKIRPMLQFMRTKMAALNDFIHDDDAGIRRLPTDLERIHKLIDDPALRNELDPLVKALSRFSEFSSTNWRDGHQDMAGALDVVQEMLDAIPPHRRPADFEAHAETAMARLRSYPSFDAHGAPGIAPSTDQLAALQVRAARPDISDIERASSYRALGMAELWRGPHETDLDRIDRAIGYFRQAVDRPTATPISTAGSWAGDPERISGLLSLATALYLRSRVAGQRDALVEAERLLTEARELAGGPESAFWGRISNHLSLVRRLLGEWSGARRAGLDGLRRHAWKVLLQSDPTVATAAAREAAARGTEVARTCLTEHEPADAIRALDAGRALVLFAATEFRDVTTRLDAAGRSDLSDRWRKATASEGVETVPAELRREALTALFSSANPTVSASGDPLDPPALHEIQSALTTLDVDALVYLVSGTTAEPGYAVIASAEGPPSSIELPGLSLDGEVDVMRYLAALSDRDGVLNRTGEPSVAHGPADAERSRDLMLEKAESKFVHSLDALCDWAWRAAIGPLLEHLARNSVRVSGRPPRVVLIPMGSLARIPWQAARRSDGTYAVQLAAFSQAASARMLCQSAALAPVPLVPVGLVVGDPDTGRRGEDLAAARIEAYAVHQAFYRGARYVGRRPDGSTSRSGAGTPAQVREWLTSARPGAGAMLHLACHGVIEVESTDTTSYLLLAGRERLTAEELIGLMAEAPEREIGLVVLAACRTGVSSRGYDEAYSLGTAFLAGGVRSVLSTQWSVPDRDTSVLMFMFHYFLMIERRPVWDALRHAQLWMLDSGRQPPATMPPPLRRQLQQTDPAQIIAWAGFVHWGQ